MSTKGKEIQLETIQKLDRNLLKIENIQDIESVSGNTEDSLLNNSRSDSQITNNSKSKRCCDNKYIKGFNLCCGFTTSVILTIIGILLFIWSPYYILMEERLNMIPGLPPLEWWKTPPDEVFLRAYIFNVTNSEEFLNGTDSKIHVQEIGPIIYLEILRHVNVTHNPNDTLSYTSVRTAKYVPQLNTIDLNSTIIVPNYALLGAASHMTEASFFARMVFRIALRRIDSPFFVKTTIYNFLWNITDPILTFAKTFQPSMVPNENYAMLDTIYRDFTDTATVYIGKKNGHEKFFLLDKFDGSEYLKGHGDSCPEKLVNASEGAIYPQYLTKNITIRYWRKTLCRIIPLLFEREQFMEDYNVLAYKFTKPSNAYNRKENLDLDCHKGGEPPLLSGLSDVSQCFHGVSMAASYPHYLYGSVELQNMVEGLKPNKSKHESYIFVEPLTGIPITSVARSQSNMIIKDVSIINKDLEKFSNLSIPMFWLEYEQMGLPYYVKYMMNFTVNWCPKYQYYVITLIFILGLYLFISNIVKIYRNYTKKNQSNYKKNTKLQFEKQNFIKQ